MRSDRYLALVEFAIWVVAASALVVAVCLPLGLLIGGDLVGAKYALFLAGVVLFGVGSIAIQPSGPNLEGSIYSSDGHTASDGGEENGDRASDRRTSGLSLLGGRAGRQRTEESGVVADDRRGGENAFEARIQTVGPLADRHLPAKRLIGRRYKIFVTGIVVLAVSFLMEVIGVQI